MQYVEDDMRDTLILKATPRYFELAFRLKVNFSRVVWWAFM